jgi:hypothetical protein
MVLVSTPRVVRSNARRRGWVVATALMAACVAGASVRDLPEAHAQASSETVAIAVPTIYTVGADDQADALTKALRNAVNKAPGWRLAPGDYSLEVVALQKCEVGDANWLPDALCIQRIADALGTDRLLWGTLGVKSGQAVGELRLWTRGKGEARYPLAYASTLTEAADQTLGDIAAKAVLALTGGPPAGSVRVQAGTGGGQVFADGTPLGELKDGAGTFTLPQGAHVVLVRVPGFADSETQVQVKLEQRADVTLTLVPKGEVKIDWRLVGGIASLVLGAGGAAAGFAGVALVSDSQSTVNAQKAAYLDEAKLLQVTNICALATNTSPTTGNDQLVSAACSQGSTGELLQIAGFSSSAAFLGLGIGLLATRRASAPTDDKPKVTFVPWFGTRGAGATFGMVF